VRLDLRGTPFERSVWQRLLDILPGSTRTYADIARELGKPNAARAVGLAVGSNPVGIIVPCHRVVGTSGSPGCGGELPEGVAARPRAALEPRTGGPAVLAGRAPEVAIRLTGAADRRKSVS
jgi:methylated-DNA-[protein]-cysteine S-methyltransferase